MSAFGVPDLISGCTEQYKKQKGISCYDVNKDRKHLILNSMSRTILLLLFVSRTITDNHYYHYNDRCVGVVCLVEFINKQTYTAQGREISYIYQRQSTAKLVMLICWRSGKDM